MRPYAKVNRMDFYLAECEVESEREREIGRRRVGRESRPQRKIPPLCRFHQHPASPPGPLSDFSPMEVVVADCAHQVMGEQIQRAQTLLGL